MKKLKKHVFLWYSQETDCVFELDLETTVNMINLMIRHDLWFNRNMLFLGEL